MRALPTLPCSNISDSARKSTMVRVAQALVSGDFSSARLFRSVLLCGDHILGGLVARRPQLHERFGFLIKALPFFTVEYGFAHNAEDGFGTEIVFVVKLVDHFHHVLTGKAGIFDLRNLVA